MNKKKAPERIYLQDYGSIEPTWCADHINADDVEYVRADLVDRAIRRARMAPPVTKRERKAVAKAKESLVEFKLMDNAIRRDLGMSDE